MLDRPEFSRNIGKEEFLKHYWYRAELQAICSKYGLPAAGTKAELQKYIAAYLDGDEPENMRKHFRRKRRGASGMPLTLETKLIGGGFAFNQEARAFFAAYYGVPKFSFTKAMATALRQAEARQDLDMTVQDLINIYENKGTLAYLTTEEDATYQWNNFLKAFHADGNTKAFRHKHQIAALLWRHVRDTPGEKKYVPALLHRFCDEIKRIEKVGYNIL